MSQSKRLRLVDTVAISDPCKIRQEAFIEQPGGWYCGDCQKKIHDFSQLTRFQAEMLLARSQGRCCAYLQRDFDGRIIFRKYPWPRFMLSGSTLVLGFASTLLAAGAEIINPAISYASPDSSTKNQVPTSGAIQSEAARPKKSFLASEQISQTNEQLSETHAPSGVFGGIEDEFDNHWLRYSIRNFFILLEGSFGVTVIGFFGICAAAAFLWNWMFAGIIFSAFAILIFSLRVTIAIFFDPSEDWHDYQVYEAISDESKEQRL